MQTNVLYFSTRNQKIYEVLKTGANLPQVGTVAFEAKYLGLTTPEGRMKAEMFQLLVERLRKRCSAWDIDQKAQLLLLLWRTWFVRNQIVHNEERLTIEGCEAFLRKFWTEL